MSSNISKRLLAWYDQHGRRDLPWQGDRNPYKIWVSEIMLQQTQVSTVIPYFERFVARFPDIQSLSDSPLDEVLHLWTGLGYYARGRNLHRAAQTIVRDNGGRFPADATTARGLPGVGRSTANAILAFAFDQSLPILDGNAKRVLARHFRVHGWPGKAKVERRLWDIAENNTPKKRSADYTQAIMDLGALICVRRRPLCTTCPIAGTCQALCHREQALLPAPAPKREKPLRSISMIMAQFGDSVLLERRPPSGIWGGLWSFPEVEPGVNIQNHMSSRFGVNIRTRGQWDVLRHSFTHFHLDITPVHADVDLSDTRVMENPGSVWYNLYQPDARGLAAPVKRLLEKLR
jgi:A/G-specific adenine glycosylase